MTPQNGEGIRVSNTVVPGGNIIVNVGPNSATVEVSPGGSSETKSHDVPGGKNVSIPTPLVPPGTSIIVRIGKGANQRRVIVIVVAPSP